DRWRRRRAIGHSSGWRRQIFARRKREDLARRTDHGARSQDGTGVPAGIRRWRGSSAHGGQSTTARANGPGHLFGPCRRPIVTATVILIVRQPPVASKASHVDLAGTLFIVWGLLTTLIGVSTLALGIGAIALIMSASRDAGGQF